MKVTIDNKLNANNFLTHAFVFLQTFVCILSVLSYASAGFLGTPYANNGGYADNSPLPLPLPAPAPVFAAPAPQQIISAPPQQVYSAPPQEIHVVEAPVALAPAPVAVAPAPQIIKVIKVIQQLPPPPPPQHIKIIKVVQPAPQPKIIRVIEEQGPSAPAPQLIKVIKVQGNSYGGGHSNGGGYKVIKIINGGGHGW